MKSLITYKVIVALALILLGIGSFIYYKHAYTIKVKQGQTIDNIIAPGINGEPLSLGEINNKIVLVQFWASWCGPCVRELPSLIKVYSQYSQSSFKNADGFEIFALSLDKDRQRWKEALNKYRIPWRYNACDELSFKSPIAKRLNVVSIPSNILVDSALNVIGVNLNADELTQILRRFQ